jgi:hypothetical protein
LLVSLKYLLIRLLADQDAPVGESTILCSPIHLIIWLWMSGRMVAVPVADAGIPRAARLEERKVRTPQSSVPDNVREGALAARFGAALKWLDGKCHRKYTARSASSG